MPPTRAPSAASKQTRTARTAAWLEKTSSKTALPYDWTEKEVYLQQLVDVGLLSTAEAQAMAASHAPVAAAPEGDGGAAAAAPAPDLATVKTMLYSQHSTAPVNQTKNGGLALARPGGHDGSQAARPAGPLLAATVR